MVLAAESGRSAAGPDILLACGGAYRVGHSDRIDLFDKKTTVFA